MPAKQRQTLSKPRIDSISLKWDYDEDDSSLSCHATATVSYPITAHGDRRLEWLSSGGLHGIDRNSDETYRREIELDELSDLADHLAHFGIYMTAAQRKGK